MGPLGVGGGSGGLAACACGLVAGVEAPRATSRTSILSKSNVIFDPSSLLHSLVAVVQRYSN